MIDFFVKYNFENSQFLRFIKPLFEIISLINGNKKRLISPLFFG